MTHGATKVTLNNSNYFFSVKGLSILDSAKASGMVLEHSCRTGKCGACKTKIIQGSTRLTQPETSLTDHEINNGIILTCCREAESDLQLDTNDLGDLANIQTLTLPCRIDSIDITPNKVAKVFLRLPPSNTFNCLSGQYINIVGSEGAQRSYSIANYFPASKKIELQIRKVDNGIMSHFWFNGAKSSDLLRFNGPHGTFFFRKQTERRIIFLATGTGIAPVKSMLEQFENNPALIANKSVEVYWGNRTVNDFYWSPEFKTIKINFIPVVSQPSNDWLGQTGYVQDIAILNNPDLSDAVVYASGSPAMINCAKSLLTQKDLKEGCFFSDAFYSS